MTAKTDAFQVGLNVTPTNNFTLVTDGSGGVKLARGNPGSTTQDILTVDATGNVTITGGQLAQTSGSAYTAASAPVFPSSGAFGDATGSIWYRKLGRTVFFRATITINSNGTGGGAVNMTMPFAGAGVEQTIIGREGLSIGFPFIAYLRGNTMTMYKMDTTYPGGNNYVLYFSGTYEATS